MNNQTFSEQQLDILDEAINLIEDTKDDEIKLTLSEALEIIKIQRMDVIGLILNEIKRYV